jgi:hypothetical protein
MTGPLFLLWRRRNYYPYIPSKNKRPRKIPKRSIGTLKKEK